MARDRTPEAVAFATGRGSNGPAGHHGAGTYPGSSFAFSLSYGYGGYLWPVYRPYGFRPYVGLHYRYPFRRW